MNDMFRRMDWCGTSVFDNYCHHLISLKCPLALGPSLSYHQFGPWPNRACAVLLPHDESLGCDGDSCRSLHKFLNEGRPKIRINPDNPACFAGPFCSWLGDSSLENIKKHSKKPSTIIIIHVQNLSNGEKHNNSVLPGHRRTLTLEAEDGTGMPSPLNGVDCRLSSMRSFVLGPRRTFQRQRWTHENRCMPSTSSLYCFHGRKRPAWGLGQEVEVNQIQQLLQNTLND